VVYVVVECHLSRTPSTKRIDIHVPDSPNERSSYKERTFDVTNKMYFLADSRLKSSTRFCKRYSNPCTGLDGPWRFQKVEVPDFTTFGTCRWQDCQPHVRAVFTPPPPPHQEIFLILIFVRGWVDPRATVRPEVLRQWNIPMTPLGIKPTIFRLIAQCFNKG
jgi:hypothetical protein